MCGLYGKWYVWSVACRVNDVGSIVCIVSGM